MSSLGQQDADDLVKLAVLIRQRNAIETEITRIIDRPASLGHLGEYVASRIFDIALARSATEKGIDGHFASGPLRDRSVNIKWYPKQEGLLAIEQNWIPDYYLVVTGPRAPAISSRGLSRPWIITTAYLFDAHQLVTTLAARGVKFSGATGVRQEFWNDAEIFPTQRCQLLPLSDEQRRLLALFG